MATGSDVTQVYTTAETAPGYGVPVQLRTVTERTTFQDIDVKGCKKNGGLQVILGGLCMIFGIVSICIDTYYGYLATPFWCGIWFILAGFCGSRVAGQQGYLAQKSLTSYMTLSSIAVIFAITLLIMMSIALANEANYPESFHNYSEASRIAIDSVLLFLSFVEIIAATRGVGIAQKTLREAKRQTTVTTTPLATAPAYPTSAGYPTPAGYPPAAGYPTGAAYPPAPGPAPYGYQPPNGPGPVQPPPPAYTPSVPPAGPATQSYGAVAK